MALIADHYVINIARTREVRNGDREFEHHFRVELPHGRTKKESIETYEELTAKYPAPQYQVSLTSVICRGSLIAGG